MPDSQLIVPAQPLTPYHPPPSAPIALQMYAPRPDLAKALAAARDRCRVAEKKGLVKFKGGNSYAYAEADEIIAVANDALEGSELTPVPVYQELVVIGAGNTVFCALNRTMLIEHSSGQSIPLEVKGWPVITTRGLDLDKALAVALTSSLAYLLRDLLLIQRGPAGDMNAQSGGSAPPQAQPVPHPPAPAALPDSPTITPEQRQALVELARQYRRTPQEVSAILATVQCQVLEQLPAALAGWAATQLTQGPSSTEQRDRIAALVQEGNFSWDAVNAKLLAKFGASRVAMLSSPQATEIIAAMETKSPAA